MKLLIEFISVVTIIVLVSPLESDRLIPAVGLTIFVWWFTQHNAYNDGYNQALEDRVY